MNKPLILAIAKMLEDEALPQTIAFDFSLVISGTDRCGYVGCAIGAIALHPALGPACGLSVNDGGDDAGNDEAGMTDVVCDEGRELPLILADRLGLPYDAIKRVFYGIDIRPGDGDWRFYGVQDRHVTPQMVAQALRRLVVLAPP